MGQFMKGSFMSLKNCNIDPALYARPLEGEYKKTILLIRGVGGIGKTTLSTLLFTDKFYYLSVALTMIDVESDILPIVDFVEEYGDGAIFNIHILSEIIVKQCLDDYIDFLFKKYINNEFENIIMDGYLFMFPEAYSLLRNRCNYHEYRLWDIKRIV